MFNSVGWFFCCSFIEEKCTHIMKILFLSTCISKVTFSCWINWWWAKLAKNINWWNRSQLYDKLRKYFSAVLVSVWIERFLLFQILYYKAMYNKAYHFKTSTFQHAMWLQLLCYMIIYFIYSYYKYIWLFIFKYNQNIEWNLTFFMYIL